MDKDDLKLMFAFLLGEDTEQSSKDVAGKGTAEDNLSVSASKDEIAEDPEPAEEPEESKEEDEDDNEDENEDENQDENEDETEDKELASEATEKDKSVEVIEEADPRRYRRRTARRRW